MTKYLVSSKEVEGLREGNHIFNTFCNSDNEIRSEIIEALYGFKPELVNPWEENKGKEYGIEHTIMDWDDDSCLFKRSDGVPLDIVVVEKGDRKFWIPYIEYVCIQEVIKVRVNLSHLHWGYINMQSHHLGKYKSDHHIDSIYEGYVIWVAATHREEYPEPIQGVDL